MKRFLLYLLATLAPGLQAGCAQDVSWAAVERLVRSRFPDVEQLPPDTLAAWLNDPARPAPLLLDVRQPEEYAVSHLPGAVRVDPDAEVAAVEALIAADREAPVVLYCSVGYRSSALADRLQQAGFSRVANLEGSIFRWANEGHAVVRGDSTVRAVHPYDAAWGRLLDAELRHRPRE